MKSLGYFLVFLFVNSFAQRVEANPSLLLDKLASKPLSVLDWGMYKLETAMTETLVNTSVSYDPKEGRIKISTGDITIKDSKKEVEDYCIVLIMNGKKLLGVDHASGGALMSNGSLAYNYFTTSLGDASSWTNNSIQYLDNALEFKCYGFFKGTEKAQLTSCRSSLLSKDIFCSVQSK